MLFRLWCEEALSSTNCSGGLTAVISQFKVLMEHLDHDEEDDEGEASANARNKAINSLLKGSKPLNHNHNHQTAETDEEDSADENHPAVRRWFSHSVASSVPFLLFWHCSAAETQKEQRLCGGFRSLKWSCGGHGRCCCLLSKVQRQAADRQGHREDQTRLQHTLDDWILLWALGCSKEAGWSQKGSLGWHY